MPRKPKSPQGEDLQGVSGRDLFQTPRYAIDILYPFLEDLAVDKFRIWECACGKGKIVDRLYAKGFDIFGTDLQGMGVPLNFLTDKSPYPFDCIVTNPPFSLKRKFYEKCREYNVPFALLIPADYSGWIIKAIQEGAEKILPTRRIDYITPTGLSGASGHTSYYHSMWLTWGFNLGRSETFVELTKKMKENI